MKNGSRIRAITLALILMSSINVSAQTTIIAAAQGGDLETVARLLKVDPKLIEAKTAKGDTMLHAAAGCRRGETSGLPIVRFLLENGALLDSRNEAGQTPLLYAVYGGFRQITELLISKGAAVQYQDSRGRSPLHYAAREGHPEIVEVLLKKGAISTLKDSQNRTPLEYAVLNNRTGVVETMMRLTRIDPKSPEGSMILHSAAAQGNETLVKDLLDQGADPGRPSPNGEAILVSYLRGGLSVRAVEAIAKGADVNAKDSAGRPVLLWAVEKGLKEAVAALLDKGADANAADKSGRTAFDIAHDWGYESLAALLTSHGARPTPPKAYLLKAGSFDFADPPDGAEAAVIRYLGNEGFLIEAGSKSVIVDGLVRNSWGYVNTPERTIALMKAAQAPFKRIDLLLFSHAHLDHFEPNLALQVLSAHPQAALIGDSIVSGELRTAGPDAFKTLGPRIKTMDVKIGEWTTLTVNGIPLRVLGVNHDDASQPFLVLGYIMKMGGFKIYHQGDMFPGADLPLLRSFPWEDEKIDVVFVDPFFFQNEESTRILLERIRPSVVILMHMMDGEVERYYGQLKSVVPQVLVFREPMESKSFVKDKR